MLIAIIAVAHIAADGVPHYLALTLDAICECFKDRINAREKPCQSEEKECDEVTTSRFPTSHAVGLRAS